jgi:hypothetical protein
MNEPFARQPEPVTVSLAGDDRDVDYWRKELMRRAGFKGDDVQQLSHGQFKIYPRAVND